MLEKRQKADISASDNNTLDLVTSYEYDENNLLVEVISPNGITIKNEY
ncbi:MAG: RHS repeat protein [Candidatus Peribacteria bacterium]|nr:RHS repeat protein [Candidatus Peribacteria bacterium]